MMAGKVYLPNLTHEIRRPSIIPQKKKKSAEREGGDRRVEKSN